MSNEEERAELFKVATEGIHFEKWAADPATKLFIAEVERRAHDAKGLCLTLSPLDEPHSLLEAQYKVRLFTELNEIVESFITSGKAAFSELEFQDNHGEYND